MKAAILTPYTTTESPRGGDGYIALVGEIFDLTGLEDVTRAAGENIIPEINLYEVEVVCDAETLALIDADNRFAILWSEP